jgi:heat shock protein HtpX
MILWIIGGLFVVVFGYHMTRLLRFGGRIKQGNAAMERGDLDAAERYFQRGLKIAQAMPKKKFDSEVMAWLSLSLLAQRRKMPEEAMRHASRAVKAMDGIVDRDNRFHLVFDHIAEVLEANGEFTDAIQFRQDSVASIEAARGKDSPEITLALINLARAIKDAGRSEEAAAVYERAAASSRPKTSSESVNKGAATMEMATTLHRCKKYDEAERLFREAIKIFSESQGADAVNVSLCYSNLGVMYAETDRHEQSLEAYQECLLIRRKRFGEQSSEVAWVENNRANCLRKMGRLDQAEMVLKDAVEVLRAERHSKLASALDTLGDVYLDDGRYAEAEAAFREACSLLRAQPDHDRARLGRFIDRHATALIHLGRDAEAVQIKSEAETDASKSRRPLASILQEYAPDRPSPGEQRIEQGLQTGGASLQSRAILAVSLTIGFYALASACIGYCGWGAWRMFEAHSYRMTLYLALSAGAIVVAAFPRRDRFEAPGPELFEGDQPELFAIIQNVANAAGERMPEAVYLIPEENAYVGERGGRLGFGAHRIMGIGLPLLQTLSVDELRFVIAHEFGHYVSGDTRFSNWIYTARAAVIRSSNTFLFHWAAHLLFQVYANLFLRVTLSVARRQEFVADATAARITSPETAASALRAINSTLYATFWWHELGPVIRSGSLPPISEGLEIFRSEHLDDEFKIRDERTGPYDTHPPLALRLKALSKLPPAESKPTNTASAKSLIRDIAGLERRLVEAGSEQPEGGWTTIEWRDCAEKVFTPAWQAEVVRFADVFSYIRIKDVPSIVPDRAAARIGTRKFAEALLSHAIGLALLRDGWGGTGAPGNLAWFTKGSHRLNPSKLVHDLWAAKLTDADWRALMLDAGISEILLVDATPESVTSPEFATPR